MTRRPTGHTLCVLGAAALIVGGNAWTLVSATWNRTRATGGTLELTEDELGLPRLWGDSTALFLHLRWEVPGREPGDRRSPAWLTVARLEELGFDCRMPPDSPEAVRHYAALPALPVFLVLELRENAGQAAPPGRDRPSRLLAVDAGRDGEELRQKYGGTGRHVLVRGVVRVTCQVRSVREGTLLPEPRLRPLIETVLPDQVFVPPPWGELLQGLCAAGEDPGRNTAPRARFAARVSWGRNYEPLVEEVRLLPKEAGLGKREDRPVGGE